MFLRNQANRRSADNLPVATHHVKSLYTRIPILSNITRLFSLLLIVFMCTSSGSLLVTLPNPSNSGTQLLSTNLSNIQTTLTNSSLNGYTKVNQYESNGRVISIYHPNSDTSKAVNSVQSDKNNNSDVSLSLNALPPQQYNGCTNPLKDALVVDNQMYKWYYSQFGFTYDSIPAQNFGSLTPQEIIQYRMLILEPNWQNATVYYQGMLAVKQALQMSSCLVVSIRAANQIGMLTSIDPLGTSFDDTTYHNQAKFINSTHPFLTGSPYGGWALLTSDFQNWQYTDLGEITNLPTSQPGYQEILKSNSGGPTMIEYNYGRGRILLDVLSDFGGAWGTGDTYVAENYIKYLNYSSYEIQAPTLAHSPGNFTYKEKSTGNLLSWNFVDYNPQSWQVLNDSKPYKSGVWFGGPININVDGFNRGTYNLTIIATDSTGKIGRDTIFLSVIDGTVPTFSATPFQYSYAYGTIGNFISWTASDDTSPDVYVMYIDNTAIDFGPWQNNVPITQFVDGLSVGNHNYTIQIFDKAGNFEVNSVDVSVILDTQKPVLSQSPGNVTYQEGSVGNDISWVETDQFPSTYYLLLDGLLVGSGSWQSGVPLGGNVDGFSYGVYNLTVIFTDTIGNFGTDTIWINVTDGTDPTFRGTPADMQYELGDTSTFKLIWQVSDNNPNNFVLSKDGSEVLSASWNSNDNISVNVGGQGLGTYTYDITFYDIDGNFIQDSVTVTVVDTTKPLISGSPSISYEEGSTGNAIIWYASDLNPNNYQILHNSTQIYATGSWSASNPISINVDDLEVGYHNFTLRVTDGSGNSEIYTTIVDVVDTTNPSITGTSDFSYEVLSTGNSISWTGIDNNPYTQITYRNNQIISSGSWLSEQALTYNIDSLSVGYYNFTIIMYDTSMNFKVDTIWITVLDTTSPTFESTPINLAYSEGTTGNNVSWTATDPNPASYEITRNSVLIASGTWYDHSPIVLNVDGLSIGVFTYNITIYDDYGNANWSTVEVSIISKPSFRLSPSDLAFTNDTTGNTLTWIIEDLTPDTYNITLDGVLVTTSQPWTSGQQIIVNVDSTIIGVYNYTIYANDTDGNIVSDWAIVTITDNPWFEARPSDLGYNEGDTGNSLSWDPIDTEPAYYELYRNGTLVNSTTWDNSSLITINVDGLSKGIYNFTMIIYDLSGNIGVDSVVWVTVSDGTNPLLTVTPNDMTINESSTGNVLVWKATDTYASTYNVTVNSVLYTSGSWISNTNISIDIDALPLGVNTVQINVYDESGNFATDSVIVTVQDNLNPTTNTPNNIQYEEGTTGQNIIWTVSDSHPDWYIIYQDGVPVSNGNWSGYSEIPYNVDGLTIGTYQFKLYLNDTSGNFGENTVTVTVVDTTAPTVSTPSDFSYDQGTTSNVISWLPIDTNSANYTVYQNGTFYTSGNWDNNTLINVSVDGLPFGFYEFKINLNDTSGNYIEDIVIVHVMDIAPVITPHGNVSYEDGTTTYDVIWTVTDYDPAYYWVHINGSEFISGTWSSGSVTIDFGGFSRGTYNLNFFANDTQGLQSMDSIVLTVVDTTNPSLSAGTPIFTIEQGDTSQQISWTFTDENPNNYEIKQGSNVNQTGSWTSNTPITFDIQYLALGQYNLTITVYDLDGHSVNDTVTITIEDTTAPSISSPGQVTYVETDTGNQIVWNVTDFNANMYNITKDGLFNTSGVYTSGQSIIINVDGLAIGSYTFTLFVNDTLGNSAKDDVIVLVTDASPPTLSNEADITYEYGTSGNTLSWQATDTNNDHYDIFINGVFNTTGSWSSSANITFSIDGFTLGSYTITIDVYDTSNNKVSDIVLVDVVDTTDPILQSLPGTLQFEENVTQNTILNWTVTDYFPNDYVVYRDYGYGNQSTFIISTPWIDGSITSVNFGILNIDVYNFTIVFSDTSANQVSWNFILKVEDTTAPVFSQEQQDFQIDERITSYYLQWNASDNHPKDYFIYVDGIEQATGLFQNYVLIKFYPGGRSVGIHNVTIVIFDVSGNSASSTMALTILDTIKPTVENSPIDMTYNETSTGNILSWKFSDEQPYNYTLYINGTAYVSGFWLDNDIFTTNIDGLSKGLYNITIAVNDQSLNLATYTIYVTVIDSTKPLFTDQPQSNLAFTEDTVVGEILSWTVNERYPLNYTLLLDGVQIQNGTFTSDNPIIYDLSAYQAGIYNFTIIFLDESFNKVQNAVLVSILDVKAPVFNTLPSNFDRFINETDLSITWNLVDSHPSSYTILKNGELYTSGIWTSGNDIVLDLSKFPIGVYNITIIVYDQSNNYSVDQVNVKLKDPSIIETIDPEFDLIQVVYEGNVETISGTWVTKENNQSISNGIVTVFLYDTSKQEIFQSYVVTTDQDGFYSLTFNYTALAPRNYIWEISFEKASYESWSFDIPVKVIPHNYRIEIQVHDTLERGKSYYISATVYYDDKENGTSSLSLNSFNSKNGQPAVGLELEFLVLVLYLDGSNAQFTKKTTTFSNGVGVIEFTGLETRNMASIDGINAHINSDFGVPNDTTLDASKLPTVTDSPPSYLETLVSQIASNGLLIGVFLLILLFTVGLFIYFRRSIKKKYKSMLRELDTSKVEFDSLISIRAIILQTQEGIPAYDLRTGSEGVDASLISGVVTAISAFLSEFSDEEMFGFETMQRQGLSITSHKGKLTKLIIISDEELPLIMMDKLAKSHTEIEDKFEPVFEDFTGDQLPPEDMLGIFENNSIHLAMLDRLTINVRNIRKIMKIKSISRLIKDQIRKLPILFSESEMGFLTLDDILEKMEEVLALSSETIARIMLLAYKNEILLPVEQLN